MQAEKEKCKCKGILDEFRKAKAKLELKLSRDKKVNKKDFFLLKKYISSKEVKRKYGSIDDWCIQLIGRQHGKG